MHFIKLDGLVGSHTVLIAADAIEQIADDGDNSMVFLRSGERVAVRGQIDDIQALMPDNTSISYWDKHPHTGEPQPRTEFL